MTEKSEGLYSEMIKKVTNSNDQLTKNEERFCSECGEKCEYTEKTIFFGLIDFAGYICKSCEKSRNEDPEND